MAAASLYGNNGRWVGLKKYKYDHQLININKKAIEVYNTIDLIIILELENPDSKHNHNLRVESQVGDLISIIRHIW